MAMQRILVEICCGSLEDALEAERGGADRVELCSALFLGGLTPSLGTIIEAKARLKIPIMVMIRPREEDSATRSRKWRSWNAILCLLPSRAPRGWCSGY